MLREWTDALPDKRAAEVWQRERIEAGRRRQSAIERELEAAVEEDALSSTSFYEAMRHFITLRAKLFPQMPLDPAWNILVTLSGTPEGDARSSVTSIAYGAGVPLATALRYISAMELDGIVERLSDPDDKRRTIIQLTDEGRRRLEAIASQWKLRAAIILTAVPIGLVWALRLTGIV